MSVQPWALDLLACPSCRRLLRPEGDEGLRCLSCRAEFPVVGSIPRFVETSGYAESFSFEWLRFRRTQLDSASGGTESENRFRQSVDFPLSELKGQLVLDAGCGMGRFAEVALKYGARVVAMDMSQAVKAAVENVGRSPMAQIVQADILRPPFSEGIFDFIYSLGVLHHTADPRGAFLGLTRLLKPGGKISITLYSGSNRAYVLATNFWRPLLTRLPKRLVYYLSHAAGPLYHIYRIPVLGLIPRAIFPISMHPNAEWRVLDTFDCYTPRFQSYHTHPEVFQWFRGAGLSDIAVLEPGVSMIGTRSKPSLQPR